MKIDTSVQAKWLDTDSTIEFELRMSTRLDLGRTVCVDGEARPRLDNEISIVEVQMNKARFLSAIQEVQSALARAVSLIEAMDRVDSWDANFNFAEEPSLLFSEGYALYAMPSATLQWCNDGALAESESGLALARQVAKAVVAVAGIGGEVSFYDHTTFNLA